MSSKTNIVVTRINLKNPITTNALKTAEKYLRQKDYSIGFLLWSRWDIGMFACRVGDLFGFLVQTTGNELLQVFEINQIRVYEDGSRHVLTLVHRADRDMQWTDFKEHNGYPENYTVNRTTRLYSRKKDLFKNKKNQQIQLLNVKNH